MAKGKPKSGNGASDSPELPGSTESDNGTDSVTSGSSTENAGSNGAIDPAAFTGSATDDQPRRGRGRPRKDDIGAEPKRAKNSSAKTAQMDLAGLNALLFSIHSLLAAGLNAPEVALDSKESEQLANAVARVSRHYNLGASQKTLDWGNLMMALGIIYVPRVMMIRARHAKEDNFNPAANENIPENYTVTIPPVTMQ